MSTLDVAVAALGVNSALTTGTVRRVSPWPKAPAPSAQGQGSRSSRGSGTAAGEQTPDASSPAPPGGTS